MALIEDLDALVLATSYTNLGTQGSVYLDYTNKVIYLREYDLLSADGVTLQAFYSFLKSTVWRYSSTVSNDAFSNFILDASTPIQMDMLDDWRFADTTSMMLIRNGGLRFFDSEGVLQESWVCVKTLGVDEDSDVYWKVEGEAAVEYAYKSGNANQLVKIYDVTTGLDASDVTIYNRNQGKTYRISSSFSSGYYPLINTVYYFGVDEVADTQVTHDDTAVSLYNMTWTESSAVRNVNGTDYTFDRYFTVSGLDRFEIYEYHQYLLRQTGAIDTGSTLIGVTADSRMYFLGNTLYVEGYIDGLSGDDLNNTVFIDTNGDFATSAPFVEITVSVIDINGNPIADALVYVDEDYDAEGSLANTTSDANGEATLSFIGSIPSVGVRVRKYGYQPFEGSLAATQSGSITAILSLDNQVTPIGLLTPRTDISIDWTVSPRVVTIGKPSTTCTIQELLDNLRYLETQPNTLTYSSIVSASGKEEIGENTYVGLTATLLNAVISFEARTSAEVTANNGEWFSCELFGGNLVARNESNVIMQAIKPSDYVFISKTLSSSATLMSNDSSGGGLTNEQQLQLNAIETASVTTIPSQISGLNDFDPATDTVTVSTNNDKSGYSLSGTKPTLDDLNDFDPAVDTVVNVANVNTVVTNLDMVDTPPAVADIASAVWEETTAAHTTDGTFGVKLDSLNVDEAAIAANVWNSIGTDYNQPNSFGSLANHLATIIQDTNVTIPNLIAALNDFNPATDTVANVTNVTSVANVANVDLVDTVTTLTNMPSDPLTEAQITSAVWDIVSASHSTEGTFGEIATQIATIISNTNVNIPSLILALNDFDPATDTVSHVTLVDTVTTNTDMRGTDNAFTGTVNVPTASDVANAVWDEPYAEHDASGTFGHITNYLHHIDKIVFVDTEATVNGTGSQQHPYNNIQDAIDHAEAENTRNLYIAGDIIITKNLKNFNITGIGVPEVDLNGYDIKNIEINKCKIKGEFTGTGTVFRDSVLLTGAYLDGFIENCALAGDLSCNNGSNVLLKDCASIIPGTGRPTISMNATGTSLLSLRGYSGGLTIKDCNQLTDMITVEISQGSLTFDSSCTGGQMVARGVCKFVDLTNGSVVVDETIKPQEVKDVHVSQFNRRVHDKYANTITLYDDDGITPIHVFDTNVDVSEITPQ